MLSFITKSQLAIHSLESQANYFHHLKSVVSDAMCFCQVYHGSETSCEISELEAGADYLVRACAVRLSPKGPIEGQYCSPITLSTPTVHHEPPQHPVIRQHQQQVCPYLYLLFYYIYKIIKLTD